MMPHPNHRGQGSGLDKSWLEESLRYQPEFQPRFTPLGVSLL